MSARRALGVAVATALLASNVQASGFNTARFGTEHGHPTTENATALYYNPAAITQSHGVRLYADALFVFRRFEYTRPRDTADANGQPRSYIDQPGNSGTGELSNFLVAPMLGVTWKVTDELSLGAGFFVPFGGAAEFDKNESVSRADRARYPGIEDGVARWHNIQGAARYAYYALGAAYRFGPVSVGLTGNLVRSKIETVRARNAAGIADIDAEGRTFFSVADTTFSMGAGVLFEAIDDELWLGISYQSQPGFGPMRSEGTVRNNFTGSIEESKIDFLQELPDVVRAGGRWRLDERIELRFFGDYVRWSVFDDQCLAPKGEPCRVARDGSLIEGMATQNIKRDWHDAFGVRAGASYWLTPDGLELFAGLGFDSTPVPDTTLEPALFDADDLAVAAGVGVRFSDSLRVAGSYTHQQFLTRDNRGKSRLSDLKAPSRTPDGDGIYKSWIGILNVNVELAF